jgi:hypothetical protein
VVTIATDEGWALVGVMASAQLDAKGAIALISARGLDAALQPFSQGVAGGQGSQLAWLGPTRTEGERKLAKTRALGRQPALAAVVASSVVSAATTAPAATRKASRGRKR